MLEKIISITDKISMGLLGQEFKIRVEHDNEFENGRVFLQVIYDAPCTKTGTIKEWHGRKWYLSKHMTDDEIVKTAFAAFKATVEHEVMEGFKINGIILFNPHVNYRSLLNCSRHEVSRKVSEEINTFPVWSPSFRTRIALNDGKDLFKGKKSKYYRALRNSSGAFINKALVKKFVFDKDGNKCVHCGSTENLTIDHIVSVYACSEGLIPVKELNIIKNLQTLCRSCNSSKTN